MADANKVKPIVLRDLSTMPQSEYAFCKADILTGTKLIDSSDWWRHGWGPKIVQNMDILPTEGILAEIETLTNNND